MSQESKELSQLNLFSSIVDIFFVSLIRTGCINLDRGEPQS